MPALFLAYRAALHMGGLASGWKGVEMWQNCPLACWHIWNCVGESSTPIVTSLVTQSIWCLSHSGLNSFHREYPGWRPGVLWSVGLYPVWVCQSTRDTVCFQSRCEYAGTCRNVGCPLGKLVGAGLEVRCQQYVGASSVNLWWVRHVVIVYQRWQCQCIP